jgi:uncharacterized SAM-binding protein YcdF (DUF218 family)
MRAWALHREGWAPTLVVSLGGGADDKERSEVIRAAVGSTATGDALALLPPAENTHEEALRTAELAGRRGWKTIILVTDPLHMRRAAAVFAKTGLQVVRCPCEHSEYDVRRLDNVPVRVAAFRDWMHEAIGWHVYKRRGWL